MSSLVDELERNGAAYPQRAFCFLTTTPLPIENRLDVVSQPQRACRKGRHLHTSFPSVALSCDMLQIGCLALSFSETMNIGLLFSLTWQQRSMSTSVSSAMTWVTWVVAMFTASWTIKRSASPGACFVGIFELLIVSESRLINACLFFLLAKKESFSSVKWCVVFTCTSGATVTPFARFLCVDSFVETKFSYPSKTMTGLGYFLTVQTYIDAIAAYVSPLSHCMRRSRDPPSKTVHSAATTSLAAKWSFYKLRLIDISWNSTTGEHWRWVYGQLVAHQSIDVDVDVAIIGDY